MQEARTRITRGKAHLSRGLIRPDGYVASDLDELDSDAFRQQLETWKTENVAIAANTQHYLLLN